MFRRPEGRPKPRGANQVDPSDAWSDTGSGLLSDNLETNRRVLTELLGSSPDLVFRRLLIGDNQGVEAVALYVNGLVDKALVSQHVLRPLIDGLGPKASLNVDSLAKHLTAAGTVEMVGRTDQVADAILSGDTAIIVDGSGSALVIGTRGGQARQIEEPQSEVVIRGPKDGFTESIYTNVALLRRKIRSRHLRFEPFHVGDETGTKVMVGYLSGIANPSLVKEVCRRIQMIETDSVLESGYIEEFIRDSPWSPFSTIQYSERPDMVAGNVLEGRIAILVDGTPVVLTVPMLFVENFQSSGDYYKGFQTATLERWIRILSFLITLLIPSIYVAMTTFHQELLPSPLLFTIAASTEGVPFPAAIEVLSMLVAFEILREAGLRLPRQVGQAVSIVGAIVLGEAAVSAGLVGAPVVIVVALTGISMYVTPRLADSIPAIRIGLVIVTAVLGFLGLGTGVLLLLIHLVSLRSFGVPYLSPLAPLTTADLKDVLVRAPIWRMNTRPRVMTWFSGNRSRVRSRPVLPGKRPVAEDSPWE